MLGLVHQAVFAADQGPATLLGSCGLNPGVACRLVWDLTHNGRAASLTNDYLAAPAHLVLRLAYVVVLALVIRAVVHRVINRLTERAALTILPALRNGVSASRLAPGRIFTKRRRSPSAQTGTGPATGPGAAAAAASGTVSGPVDDEAGQPEIDSVAALAERGLVDERRKQRVRALGSILRSAASVTIFSIAGVVILGDLGINLAPLLASAGVVGVAVGFGAQNLVRDYLAGIFMLLEDQYGVGDVITVGGATGTVETVSLRITRLRDVSGIVWHVRNGAIEQVGNESQGWARAVIDFPVPYTADLGTIRSLLAGAADGMWNESVWRAVMLEAPEVWGAQQVSSTEVTMRIVAKTAPLRQWEVEREMRARVKAALDSAGIHPPAAAG